MHESIHIKRSKKSVIVPGIVLVLFILVAAGCAVTGADTGFVEMFNGKDLTGWQTTGNWIVEEGNIVTLKPRPGESGW